MLIASASYMLEPLIDVLRSRAIPFHNPQRRSNGRWNPIPTRSSSTNAAQRLAAFLKISEEGIWTAEDVRTWTAVIKTSEVTKAKNAKSHIQDLENDDIDYDDNPALSTDTLTQLFSDEALDAAYAGNINWYQDHLTKQAQKSSMFPVDIARTWGARALTETPKVTVGTCHCSPADEPVLTTGGWVSIGDLDPSRHRVAGHHRHTNRMTWGGTNSPDTHGFTFQKSEHPFEGDLIIITTKDSRTRVTPNHVLPVILNDSFNDKWCCYLMRRGDWWRIGVCPTAHRPYKAGGVGGRLSTEQADAGWILSIHDTRQEATINEAIWQHRYGIPGLTFQSSSTRNISDEQLTLIHTTISTDIQPRVDHLFQDTQLQKDQPLYTRGPISTQGLKKRVLRAIFTTAAGNLLPLSGYIDVLTPHKNFIRRTETRPERAPLHKTATVTREPFKGSVYGLDVPPYHYYVSGGAVVHNSVKGGESDVVFLFPDLSASGVNEWDRSHGANAGAIYRLFYVGMTRARETLVLCSPDSPSAPNLN